MKPKDFFIVFVLVLFFFGFLFVAKDFPKQKVFIPFTFNKFSLSWIKNCDLNFFNPSTAEVVLCKN